LDFLVMDAPLKSLKLWLDPIPRSGPENMAVDEWLLETVQEAVLRVYGWRGNWGSMGRFCRVQEAQESISSVCWVRRSTGGGIVDHQRDWTYSLVIPATENLAKVQAGESYRVIHEKLSRILSDRYQLVSKAEVCREVGGVCFEKPVLSDVVDEHGYKIAGAGQRRTKEGLLHQGSVAGQCVDIVSSDRSKRLCDVLANVWMEAEYHPPDHLIRQKIHDRYGSEEWTKRR